MNRLSFCKFFIVLLMQITSGAAPASAAAFLTQILPGETAASAAARLGHSFFNLDGSNLEDVAEAMRLNQIPMIHAGRWANHSGDFIVHDNGAVHLQGGTPFLPEYTLTTDSLQRAAAPTSFTNFNLTDLSSERGLGDLLNSAYEKATDVWAAPVPFNATSEEDAPVATRPRRRRAIKKSLRTRSLPEDSFGAAAAAPAAAVRSLTGNVIPKLVLSAQGSFVNRAAPDSSIVLDAPLPGLRLVRRSIPVWAIY